MSEKSELFIEALKEGVVPATGCTEPIAVAFAAATCMDHLTSKKVEKVDVSVSPNIMKNVMAVIVPGTGQPGLLIASAAGIVAGDASKGLNVISSLTEQQVSQIKELANSGIIEAGIAPVEDDLYVEVTVKTPEEWVSVFIAGDHTNVFKIEKNGETLVSKTRPEPHAISKTEEALQKCYLKEIWDFALEEPLENIAFMSEAGVLNMNLSKEGLSKKYGLGLGRSMDSTQKIKFGSGINADLSTKIVAYTAAASDARMGGAQLPAMSNSESGNQGITATVPVCVVAQEIGSNEEQLTRALTLSHLTAIYIHAFLPILSAFCAADSAAMGSAVAVCYLMGGGYKEGCNAIDNMAGDASGMICDGAGFSCTMKVATAVSSMHRAVSLALQGVVIPSSDGMVCQTIEDTIRGIGQLGTVGLKDTDKTILSVMMNKCKGCVAEKPTEEALV